MRSLPYLQTTVFVDKRYAFGGNQLATFWNTKSNAQLSSEEMQGIALEMHFSETTFILESKHSDCVAKVRIFTPSREIRFAGHPTLGSAFVLKEVELVDQRVKTAVLELGIGPITVEYLEDACIRMTQPAPQFLNKWQDRQSILRAIGLSEDDLKPDLPLQFVTTGSPFLIIPLSSLRAVQQAVPNPVEILETLQGQPSQHILIFSTEVVNQGSDVHVRMFAPEAGVLEDPATGSAAGPMAAYLETYQVLQRKESGKPIVIEQGYELQRPSQLIAKVVIQSSIEKVLVSGRVKLVAEGTFYL